MDSEGKVANALSPLLDTHDVLLDLHACHTLGQPLVIMGPPGNDRDHADDQFAKAWSGFDPVADGAVIGLCADGRPVVAPSNGFVVFPDPSALAGHERFCFAKRSGRTLA